jgi:hypothetical protein
MKRFQLDTRLVIRHDGDGHIVRPANSNKNISIVLEARIVHVVNGVPQKWQDSTGG